MQMEFRDGLAEKAIQLHLVQRKVRQARAEMRQTQLIRYSSKVKEPNHAISHDYPACVIDDELYNSVRRDEEAMKKFTLEWERDPCRQEGATLKALDDISPEYQHHLALKVRQGTFPGIVKL